MIRKLLQYGELGDLRRLLSPGFFEVMSKSDIAALASTLYRNYRDGESFRRARVEASGLFDASGLGIRLVDEVTGDPSAPDRVLRLYFLQLFHRPTAILDLRYAHFGQLGDELTWAPAPVHYEWAPEFRSAMCDVYRAYYRGTDAEFEHAVERLGLHGAADLFREHFGAGDQTAVSFRLETFTETFRNVFEHCKAEGISLSRDFGALGVYLASLYEHLETVGGTYDVRSAAEWAMDVKTAPESHPR